MPTFPIYLDHAATTFPESRVIDAMSECMRMSPCNASAAYSAAGEARRIHRLCRRQLGSMLSCPPEDVFFTSSGTESNNWAVRAFAGEHVVLSAIEHASILEAARAAHCHISLVPPDNSGWISPESIAAAVTPQTRLICLQAANNETGVVQPVRQVYALAKQHGIHLHVDAVQAFGHIPADARFSDSMSLSAHKLYGPRGAGALYIRSGAAMPPLLCGGHQEGGRRAGTENTPAIRGFHTAAEMADADMRPRAVREAGFLDEFIADVQAKAPGVMRLGAGRERLPGVTAILLPEIPAEKAIAALDLRGILVSGGAACASQSGTPSHVYTAMGLSGQEASCVLRISIGRHTTREDLAYAADVLTDFILQQAR